MEEATRDFCTTELVQATFYVMVVNDALELGVPSQVVTRTLKDTLVDLTGIPSRHGLSSSSIDHCCQLIPASSIVTPEKA